jgi:hypothetical protein
MGHRNQGAGVNGWRDNFLHSLQSKYTRGSPASGLRIRSSFVLHAIVSFLTPWWIRLGASDKFFVCNIVDLIKRSVLPVYGVYIPTPEGEMM